MSVTTVFFDMGDTLLHYHPEGGSWEQMEKQGAGGIYDRLVAHGHQLPDREMVLQDWWETMQLTWRSLLSLQKEEMLTAFQLAYLVKKWGVELQNPADLHDVEDAYVKAIQKVVRPVPGALDALRWVKNQGLNVGLISNTMWRGSYHQADLEKHGFWQLLEYAIFSSDAMVWKPEAQVFDMALQAFKVQPHEAVYIGDSLFFDVYGAQQAGWRAVWVEQPKKWMPPGIDFPIPDASIQSMADLPYLLANWIEE